MGGETSVHIIQWRGREFPNEDSITGLEFFQLTTKLNDIELKNTNINSILISDYELNINHILKFIKSHFNAPK